MGYGRRKPTMRDVPDQELIRRVRERDKAAFAALYDRHSPPIMGLATRILRETSAAEDALQETFLTLWNKTKLYDERRGALLSWLFAVCRNICLDRLKRANAKYEIPVSGNLLNSAGQWDYHTDALSYDEVHTMVEAAIAKLRTEERSIIEYAFFSGLSHSEIATKTGMPLGSVKSLIASALKKLRGEIRENWQYNRPLE